MIWSICNWFPYHIIDFVIPTLPLIFIWVNIIIKDCEISREYRFYISHNRIKCFAAGLIKSATKRPNHTEDKPFFEDWIVIIWFSRNVEISCFGISGYEGIKKFGKSYNYTDFQWGNMLLELILHQSFFFK